MFNTTTAGTHSTRHGQCLWIGLLVSGLAVLGVSKGGVYTFEGLADPCGVWYTVDACEVRCGEVWDAWDARMDDFADDEDEVVLIGGEAWPDAMVLIDFVSVLPQHPDRAPPRPTRWPRVRRDEAVCGPRMSCASAASARLGLYDARIDHSPFALAGNAFPTLARSSTVTQSSVMIRRCCTVEVTEGMVCRRKQRPDQQARRKITVLGRVILCAPTQIQPSYVVARSHTICMWTRCAFGGVVVSTTATDDDDGGERARGPVYKANSPCSSPRGKAPATANRLCA